MRASETKSSSSTSVLIRGGGPHNARGLPAHSGTIVTERPLMHDGVDWKAAPKTAQWWAVDANGKAHWFKAPNVAAFTDFWFTESEQAPLFGYSGDWRESLTRKP